MALYEDLAGRIAKRLYSITDELIVAGETLSTAGAVTKMNARELSALGGRLERAQETGKLSFAQIDAIGLISDEIRKEFWEASKALADGVEKLDWLPIQYRGKKDYTKATYALDPRNPFALRGLSIPPRAWPLYAEYIGYSEVIIEKEARRAAVENCLGNLRGKQDRGANGD